MLQLVFRFAVGGIMVTLFAFLADLLKPKSFAGLFGAAPSVALASYAALEARSMIVGAFGFFLYACGCSYVMMRFKVSAIAATTSMLSIWLIFSVGVWLL